jgi:hypothetical protein
MASLSVTSSFAGWLMKKKRPFAVTPKGENTKNPRKIVFAYISIVCILAVSINWGVFGMLAFDSGLWAAYAINIFWAGYFAVFFSFGVYIIERSKPYSEKLKVNLKPLYLSGNEKAGLLSLLYEAAILEDTIAEVYDLLAQKIGGEDGGILKRCSVDSAVHARILRQILSWLEIKELRNRLHTPSTQYIEALQNFTPSVFNKFSDEQTIELLHLLLETENMLNEEVYLESLAEIFAEVLVKQNDRYHEIQKMLERIMHDEEIHVVLVRVIRDKYLKH